MDSTLISKLNRSWNLSRTEKQWVYRFKAVWAYPIPIKHSFLMWMIIHRVVWTCSRALKAGVGNGLCDAMELRI